MPDVPKRRVDVVRAGPPAERQVAAVARQRPAIVRAGDGMQVRTIRPWRRVTVIIEVGVVDPNVQVARRRSVTQVNDWPVPLGVRWTCPLEEIGMNRSANSSNRSVSA